MLKTVILTALLVRVVATVVVAVALPPRADTVPVITAELVRRAVPRHWNIQSKDGKRV